MTSFRSTFSGARRQTFAASKPTDQDGVALDIIRASLSAVVSFVAGLIQSNLLRSAVSATASIASGLTQTNIIGANLVASAVVAADVGGAFTPSLNFSDGRNSQNLILGLI